MNVQARRWFTAAVVVASLLAAAAPLRAQTPPASPVTAVLAVLTPRPDVDRARILKVMPDEVRATVKLYLDGKILQWYGRADGRGVVFIMNCGSIAEAKALMDELPLDKGGLATLEYTALSPLTPLRYLLAEPAPAAK